jgi:prophage antirepressor-like protein
MNALIDLRKCSEYLTIDIGGQNHPIKLSGTIDNPYFCHNDICNVLGYKDPKNALYRYVDNDDKMVLLNLKRW